MIPDAAATLRALAGAARLARFDAGGLALLGADARAFVQSFFAAVLVAPGYAVLVWLHMGNTDPPAGVPAIAAVETLGYVISWTAFPALAHELAGAAGRGHRWVGFVVALNWSKVVQMAVYLPLVLLANSAALGRESAAALSLAALTVIVVYQWFVTRTALDVSRLQAAGFTGFDVVLGFLITGATDAALQA